MSNRESEEPMLAGATGSGMKPVVLVMPFLPYPGVRHAGGRLCWHLLSVLAARCPVHLVSRARNEDLRHRVDLLPLVASLDLVEAPESRENVSIRRLVSIVWSYFRLARLARKVVIRERVRIVQIEFTEAAVFWRAPTGVLTSITCHDILSKPAARRADAAHGIRRVADMMRARVVQGLERATLQRADSVFVLSEIDRRWAIDLSPGSRVEVLPYPAGLGFAGSIRRPVAGRALFVGALNRRENIEAVDWFIDHCWARIRAQVPHATFHVVGSGASAERSLAWARIPGVKVIGPVDDVEPHYAMAAVFVAPILFGGGVIVKILDALAVGIPVVTTSRGNEGIEAPDGEAVRVADTPEKFSGAAVALLAEPEVAEHMGQLGRLHVARRSHERFASRLQDSLIGLAGRDE